MSLLYAILTEPLFWAVLLFDVLLVSSSLFAIVYALYRFGVMVAGTTLWRPNVWTVPVLLAATVLAWFSPVRVFLTAYVHGAWSFLYLRASLDEVFSRAGLGEEPVLVMALAMVVLLPGAVKLGAFSYRTLALFRLFVTLPPSCDDPVFEVAARAAGVQGVRVLDSGREGIIASWGLFRRVILVPSGFVDAWPEESRFAIYLHEFAHIRNRDTLHYLVASVVEAVFWFQPVVVHAMALHRHYLELRCDNHVLKNPTVSPVRYGMTMLEALGKRDWILPGFGALTSGRDAIRSRLAFITRDARFLPSPTRAGLVALLCLTVLMAFISLFPHPIHTLPEVEHFIRNQSDVLLRYNGFLGGMTVRRRE